MRVDENGNACPSTLGEYRDVVFRITGCLSESEAVKFLDKKISEQGRDMTVEASDQQMRELLFPMILEDIRKQEIIRGAHGEEDRERSVTLRIAPHQRIGQSIFNDLRRFGYSNESFHALLFNIRDDALLAAIDEARNREQNSGSEPKA